QGDLVVGSEHSHLVGQAEQRRHHDGQVETEVDEAEQGQEESAHLLLGLGRGGRRDRCDRGGDRGLVLDGHGVTPLSGWARTSARYLRRLGDETFHRNPRRPQLVSRRTSVVLATGPASGGAASVARLSASSATNRPSPAASMCTLESAGTMRRASGVSSWPTIASRSGTSMPWRSAAPSTSAATSSLYATTPSTPSASQPATTSATPSASTFADAANGAPASSPSVAAASSRRSATRPASRASVAPANAMRLLPRATRCSTCRRGPSAKCSSSPVSSSSRPGMIVRARVAEIAANCASEIGASAITTSGSSTSQSGAAWPPG